MNCYLLLLQVARRLEAAHSKESNASSDVAQAARPSDYEHSVNTAIRKLREALGDDPESPRFVETVPRHGYRFIAPLNTSGSQATQTREFEPSLFQRFFLLFGTTPYQRWEIMHLRMILWCLLLAYLGWRFMACIPDKWGFVLFFLEFACIGFLLVLLGFLLYTGTADPGSLSREVRRMAPWVRGSTVTLVLMTWTMAGAVVPSHRVLAAFLVLCGTAGGVKYLVFKAALDRAAFPESK